MPHPIGAPAPVLILRDVRGEDVRYDWAVGRPSLLNFFRSDCPWCISELPKLATLYRKHRDLDIDVIGVSTAGEGDDSLHEFLRAGEIDFRILIDPGNAACAALAIERLPTIVAINANGEMANVYEGASEQLCGVVEQTLLALARRDPLPNYHLVGNGCGIG